ncbi:lytic murein transglycosylase [Pacificoceanicola onchidii]|uniref:lytic murein transglycosylase n=1 Tax=Pacificoceanicola onchidii TaxID=2562685 RepID=UPI0010A61C8C|nr:lytic murein transglycosylase [Pacificoceanicola onchidii]
MRRILSALCLTALTAAAAPAWSANCITQKGAWGQYKSGFGQQAQKAGIGQRGLQALSGAKLSSITWKFESRPSSQSGVSYGDPAKFLAKRSGSSAQSFINMANSRLKKNAGLFNAIEKKYGVPGSLLVTIWGLETSWGGYTGGTSIVDGAITLASYCRRHPRFEPHAISALQLVDRGVISSKTKGGPSGELGHMQFLAGNWLRFGVDGNGDGRADPYNAADALASAANMLRRNGWKKGQPFGQGTANFRVLAAWNDSGNYQRAIAYAAERIGQ